MPTERPCRRTVHSSPSLSVSFDLITARLGVLKQSGAGSAGSRSEAFEGEGRTDSAFVQPDDFVRGQGERGSARSQVRA